MTKQLTTPLYKTRQQVQLNHPNNVEENHNYEPKVCERLGHYSLTLA